MLISKVEEVSVLVPFSREPSALSFIESSGGRGIPKTLRRCLRGEGSAAAVEVVVATCPGNGRPSPGYRGDIDDRTVKGPGSCGEHTIPCSRHVSVVPLLTSSGRGWVRT
jgi:hypothetical protein